MKFKLLTLAQKAALSKKGLTRYRKLLSKEERRKNRWGRHRPIMIVTPNGKKIEKKKYDKYQRYIRSKQWKIIRLAALEFYDNKCCKCGSRYHLQVHHRNYKHLYHETMRDLLVLCEDCHGKEHDRSIIHNSAVPKFSRIIDSML